jgi:Rrf2 family transcriptional regulator, nitric oxide-sensitive transcriptional repressor
VLTKTTLSAIRVLMYLGLREGKTPVSPRHVADHLGESPTYLAKVVRHLVRVGILRAHRGVNGGVTVSRSLSEVDLLSIVEACQGTVLGSFCAEAKDLDQTCAFHQAAAELHRVIVGVLSKWTVADLVARPCPSDQLAAEGITCLVAMTRDGQAGHSERE